MMRLCNHINTPKHYHPRYTKSPLLGIHKPSNGLFPFPSSSEDMIRNWVRRKILHRINHQNSKLIIQNSYFFNSKLPNSKSQAQPRITQNSKFKTQNSQYLPSKSARKTKKKLIGWFFASFERATINHLYREHCGVSKENVQENQNKRIAKAVVLSSNSYRFAVQERSFCSAKSIVLGRKNYRFRSENDKSCWKHTHLVQYIERETRT